ncbi:MAG: hypothetical protein AAF525_15280 [Pseudomonadota bacterium]
MSHTIDNDGLPGILDRFNVRTAQRNYLPRIDRQFAVAFLKTLDSLQN